MIARRLCNLWMTNESALTPYLGLSTDVFTSYPTQNDDLSTSGSWVLMSGKMCEAWVFDSVRMLLAASSFFFSVLWLLSRNCCIFFFFFLLFFNTCPVINCNGAESASCSSLPSPDPGPLQRIIKFQLDDDMALLNEVVATEETFRRPYMDPCWAGLVSCLVTARSQMERVCSKTTGRNFTTLWNKQGLKFTKALVSWHKLPSPCISAVD